MMRILIDIRLLSKGGQSGVEEYTVQIINHLLGLRSDCRFQLFYNGWRKAPLPQLWKLNFHNIEIIDWKVPNKIFDLWRPAIDRFIKTDLIYSPHLNILRVEKTPRILTIHDLSFLRHPCFFPLKHRLWHKLQGLKKQVAGADRIVTDSHYTKNDLTEIFKINPEKVSVVYPGINPEIKKISVKPEDKPGFPFLLYLGTLEPRKNVGLIIAAFNILKTKKSFHALKLVLAGKWGWLYQDLIRDIKQSPFTRDIIVPGPIDQANKIMLYNLAEAFIYPSFFEGFGFPPLEAQSCGCPVIAANRTSLPEILGDSAVLVDPWKSGVLAEAINSVLTSESLRHHFINLGKQNTQRFNWQKTACELLNLFSRYSS